MAQNASHIARAVLAGENARAAMERLRDRDQTLRQEYQALLQKEGLSPQVLEPRYACPRLRGHWLVDGKLCSCLRRLQRSLAYEKLSMDVPLDRCTFGTFSLDYYKNDPRAPPCRWRRCSASARTTPPGCGRTSPSLLFKGATGLGKTHLSLAIANAALEKGLGVVYGSAQSFAVAPGERALPAGRGRGRHQRPAAGMRPADPGRPGGGVPLPVRQRRPVQRGQRQNPGRAAPHHHQHQPEPERAGGPVQPPVRLPHPGRLRHRGVPGQRRPGPGS